MTDQFTARMFDHCAVCGANLNGRADKKTCSSKCRTALSKRRKAVLTNSKLLSLAPVTFDEALAQIKSDSVASFNMLAELMYSGVSRRVLCMSIVSVYEMCIACNYWRLSDDSLAYSYDLVCKLTAELRAMGVDFTNVIP